MSGIGRTITDWVTERLPQVVVGFIITVAGGIFVVCIFQEGCIFKRNPEEPTPTSMPLNPIERISFDYQGIPTGQGWKLIEGGDDKTQIVFESISDSVVGNAISIRTLNNYYYGMDYEVRPTASLLGKEIEFVGILESNADIYAFVILERDDKTITTGWLKFTPGTGKPQTVFSGAGSGEDEWQLFIEPTTRVGGEWLLFRIDLEDAVESTFGKDGWHYQGLRKFRIRGDLSLDYISIYEAQR